MGRRAVLALVVTAVCAASARQLESKLPIRQRRQVNLYGKALLLRGGDAAAGEEEVRKQIVAKLNQFPTFCVVDAEGKLIGIPNESGNHDVMWFIDADEAKEMLELTSAANPESNLRLGCTPLGNAFMVCNGWVETGDGAKYTIRAPRTQVEMVGPALLEGLKAKGVEPHGDWLFPVFCHDDCQTDTMMPFFLSSEEMAIGWARMGNEMSECPENPLAMDLRLVVVAMCVCCPRRLCTHMFQQTQHHRAHPRIMHCRAYPWTSRLCVTGCLSPAWYIAGHKTPTCVLKCSWSPLRLHSNLQKR